MSDHRQENNRVLVIDDNLSVCDDYKKILSTNKICSRSSAEINELEKLILGETCEIKIDESVFHVDYANQGEEGFNMICDANASGNPYSLAFVDIRMPPGWDGVKTVENIWRVTPDIEIVFCSAYSDRSLDEMTKQLNNKQFLFLRKPFDSIEVKQFANALCEKWFLKKQKKDQEDKLNNYTSALERENKQRIKAEKDLQENNRLLENRVANRT